MGTDNWKKVRLGDISTDNKGSYGIPASAVEYSEELYTYLRITDITDDGVLIKSGLKSVDDINASKYLLNKNDIVFARTGNSTGRSYFYDGSDGELVYAGFLVKFSLEPSKVNPKFIRYYTLSSDYKNWVKSFSTGSTRGNINAKMFANMEIQLPPRKQQDLLVKVLSSLDDKIENNKKTAKKLEEIAQALFNRWFVEFNFPDKEGKPYKDNGGEMTESELGLIPKGWEVGVLGDLVDIHDSKRIPLSKREREKREKIYPYYGAASLMDYVDDYIFDGKFILLGEDGTVITDDEKPVLQYVWGKFWVNNHAHVLSEKKGYSLNYILLLLKNLNVRKAITGAVQLKINQTNLMKLNIVMPKNVDIMSQFKLIVDKKYELYIQINNETQQLQQLRNTLLPKLMSGEIL